jgi:hypothetical protein
LLCRDNPDAPLRLALSGRVRLREVFLFGRSLREPCARPLCIATKMISGRSGACLQEKTSYPSTMLQRRLSPEASGLSGPGSMLR